MSLVDATRTKSDTLFAIVGYQFRRVIALARGPPPVGVQFPIGKIPEERSHRSPFPAMRFNVFRQLDVERPVSPMSPFNNPVVLDLLARYKSVAAITHASSPLGSE